MPVRARPIDNEAAALENIARRLRSVEEVVRAGRVLPPGFHYNVVGGRLVITRESDNATSTLGFA